MSRATTDRVPPLQPGCCQIWWARLDEHDRAHEHCLDATERARRDRYRLDADRARFSLGVVLTRLILSEHLDMAPAQVPLDRTCPTCGDPHGRPLVASPAAPAFSLSHSGDLLVVAVLAGAEVGIDVEAVRPLRETGLFGAVFSPAERAEFDRLDVADQQAAFFQSWVRKESILKATGDGLRVAMTDLTISANGRHPHLAHWSGRTDQADRITLYDLDAGDGYAASLAVLGAQPHVHEFEAGGLIRTIASG